jgi:hypothetical protein
VGANPTRQLSIRSPRSRIAPSRGTDVTAEIKALDADQGSAPCPSHTRAIGIASSVSSLSVGTLTNTFVADLAAQAELAFLRGLGWSA